MLAGCAAGGVVVGPVLDRLAARAASRSRHVPAAAAASGGAAPEGPGAVPAPAVEPAAVPPGPVAPATGTAPLPTAPDPTAPLPAAPVPAAVVTGALLALAALRLGGVPELAAYCVLLAGLVALSVVDLRVGLVPRQVLYPTLAATAVALVAASASDGRFGALGGAAIGGAGAFGVFAAVWWLYPKGMGFGDVRMAGVCGMALGWLGFGPVYVGFLAAFVLGLLFGLGNLAVRRTTRFPFAPALAAGTAVGVLWGGYLGSLWLHHG